MWIFTPAGYFSVVKKPWSPGGVLTIRSRVREDLERIQPLVDDAGDISEDKNADYQYRFEAAAESFAEFMSESIRTLSYDNFKSEVALTDPARAKTYSKVWGVLLDDLAKHSMYKMAPYVPKFVGEGEVDEPDKWDAMYEALVELEQRREAEGQAAELEEIERGFWDDEDATRAIDDANKRAEDEETRT